MVLVVLVVAGCTTRVAGPDAPPPTRQGPSREQVLLADGLCSASAHLAAEIAEARALVGGQADQPAGPGSDHYLAFVASDVSGLADRFAALPDSGVAAVDRHVAHLAAELARIEPEVTRLAGDHWEVWQLSEPERLDRVRQIVALFDSVDLGGTDPAALAREHPEFGAAHELAPSCEPPAPPSSSTSPTTSAPRNVPPAEAKDGTDLAACADGACEVAVTGSATVAVGPFTVEVTVADGAVRTVEDFPGGGSGSSTLGGVGGEVRFGNTDQMVTLRVRGLDGDTAVLEFTLA